MSNFVSVPQPQYLAFTMDQMSDEDLFKVRQDLRQALDGIAEVLTKLDETASRRRDIQAVRLASVADHEETLRQRPHCASRS